MLGWSVRRVGEFKRAENTVYKTVFNTDLHSTKSKASLRGKKKKEEEGTWHGFTFGRDGKENRTKERERK